MSGVDLQTTIVAVSSAPPVGGEALRVVVRLSGPGAHDIAAAFSVVAEAPLFGGPLVVAGLSVPGHALIWRGPRSFTGQDVVEIHLPGSPWLVDRVVRGCLAAGAVLAEAGEFTARAFLNGKLDLAQAEGVALLVAAAGARQARAAQQLLAGSVSRRVAGLSETLARLLALIEAGIDFAAEDISFITHAEVAREVRALLATLGEILAESRGFGSLSAVPMVVLLGRANAGKSTLMNWLLGRERVVASATAGTTRDTIETTLELPRGTIQLVDTSGLERDETGIGFVPPNVGTPMFGAPSPDRAEHRTREYTHSVALEKLSGDMRAATLNAAAQADIVAAILPADLLSEQLAADLHFLECAAARSATLLIRTKSDLAAATCNGVAVSALADIGRDELLLALDTLCFGQSDHDAAAAPRLALTQRQSRLMEEAVGHLSAALAAEHQHDEMLALFLRKALDSLGQITGQITPDDVIGRIFSRFCIGK